MPTTTEAAGGRRLALVIATSSYADQTLAKLQAPGRDASEFAAVLGDPAIGDFEVETVLDAGAELLRRAIARFCGAVGPTDLALVYLSCHGVLDDRGRLYYAAADTDRALLSATGVSAAWLNEQLEDGRSRRQILVLDCCHSGAFAKGAKGESGLALGERFEGRGRVVLTGSRGTEYSFERDGVVGENPSSVFTGALVEGLRSGEADLDGDGLVTVGELYDYAYEAVRGERGDQTPTLWTYGAEGDLLIARSPRGARVEPAPLPEDLAMHLESARPRFRESAVAELAELLQGEDAGRALSAREALKRVAAEDVPSVAAAARAALEETPLAEPAGPTPAAPEPPPPVQPAPLRRPRKDESPNRFALERRSGKVASRTIRVRRARRMARRRRIFGALVPLAFTFGLIMILTLDRGEEPSAVTAIPLRGSPRGIAVGEDGTWVARYDEGQVVRLGATGKEYIHVGSHPDKIAAGEGSVWVGYEDGRRLARIDPASHEVTARTLVDVPACEGCGITELEIAQGVLWVSSAERRAITRFDLITGEQIDEILAPGEGFEGAFAVGDDAAWAAATSDQVPQRSRALRIGLLSSEVHPIPLRSGVSFFSAIAYGEGAVWIADAGDGRNEVVVLDPKTEKVVGEVKILDGVSGDDLAVGRGAIFTWEARGGRLTKIDPKTLEAARERPIPRYESNGAEAAGSDLAVDGSFAWVTDPAGGTVYKIPY